MRIDAQIFNKPTVSRKEQIDTAFERVEIDMMDELIDAECIEDVRDDLYKSLLDVINHHKLVSIYPEDVLPNFWKVYGLKSCG